MIGFKDDRRINMEEIKINNSDILALKSSVRGQKTRIILSYFDSDKRKSGKDYIRNRKIQEQIEDLLEVDPETTLICLGDLNGRMKTLEPEIETDENGKMIEEWIYKYSLNHLNQSEDCMGTYTFDSATGSSAIDHILVNDKLFKGFKGMHIDEEKEILNISDHNLVRAWFKIGNTLKPNWNRKKHK